MTYADIIKKSVLEGFSYSDVSTIRVLIALSITFLIGLYIFFVYRLVTKNAFYFKNFNISMTIISVVTAGIILAMQSSIVISLGMVGALSIVRFRTAIKDPLDLLFLFWSIGTGIICGAGLYEIAIILAVFVTVGILFLNIIPMKINSYLLVVNGSKDMDVDKLMEMATKYGKCKVRSKNLGLESIDMIIEMRIKEEKDLIKQLSEIPGVKNLSLLSHEGEVKA